MATFDRKDVFSWANCEEAKRYLGKECYFGDTLAELYGAITSNSKRTLKDIKNSEIVPTQCIFNDDGGATWGLCLLADKVKEVKEKKKYIPFKAMFEFVNTVDKRTGDTIRIRAKKDNPLESVYLITGFTETHAHELKYIHLSAISYSPQELLKNYEYFANGTWHPFGIEE